MAVSLKDYNITEYTGLYISKKETSFGYKYMCRFQHNGKKYVKILGYSKKDNLVLELAHKKFLDYKAEIVGFNDKSKHHIDLHSHLDDKLDNVTLQELLRIATSYYKLLGSSQKVELALKRRYQKNTFIPYQIELLKMQEYLEHTKQKMIILFEGRDASGKGGAIRTISRFMNSKHYRIVALGKPNEKEKSQWFFQKYVEKFPREGEIVFFDRSWYNRAMVEPVFNFCTQEEYENFFLDVKQFERSIVRSNTILIKLYYSVTKDIQAVRFARRSKDPLRKWKLSEVDLQAQELWDVFTEKKYRMLKDSEIHEAPWQIIRSNDKYLTRLESIKAILKQIDYPNKNQDLDYDPNKNVLCNAKDELNAMRQERN